MLDMTLQEGFHDQYIIIILHIIRIAYLYMYSRIGTIVLWYSMM